MAENKKGFILYADQKELFDQLPNDKAGELIKHIFAYVNDENPESKDLLLNLAFTPIKQQLKRDLDKWESKQGKNAEAGKKSAGVKAWKKWLGENDSSNLSISDHQFEKGRCAKYMRESHGEYMYYYWVEAIKFHSSEITRLEKESTKSTPVENVATESTVKDNVTVTVNDTVKVNDKSKVYSIEVHDCFNDCLNYFDEHLHPDEKQKNNWLDTIDKLNRIEKIPFDYISKLVKQTREDDFWSSNFLSLTKLRKKNKDGIMYLTVFHERFKKTPGAKNSEPDVFERLKADFDKIK